MKRFLLFLLTLVLVYLGVILGAKIVWACFFPKTLAKDFIPADVHTIVIGASHGECSWDDGIILGTKNLCSSGFTNLDAYYELKYCLDKCNSRIDTVILAQTITNYILYDDELFNKKSTIIYSEQRALLDYKLFFETYRSCPNYYKTQVGSARWIKSLLDCPYSKGFMPMYKNRMSDANYLDIDRIIMKTGGREGLTSEFLRDNYSLQIKWLKAISDLCYENGIVLTILCPPLFRIPDMISFNGFYHILCEVLPAETLVADYSRFPMPDSTYFSDPQHVGHKGAFYFSKQIAANGIEYHPVSYYLLHDTAN